MRKIAAIFISMAMAIMIIVTVIPHHHHHSTICFNNETCLVDECGCSGCSRSDTNDTDEGHCIAEEKYVPSEKLQIDKLDILIHHYILLSDEYASTAETLAESYSLPLEEFPVFSLKDAPVLSIAGANAPPSRG